MRNGLTAKVRGCITGFSNRKTFSASTIARLVEEPNAPMVRAVFANLLKRGEIIKKGPGRYSYKGISKLWKKENPVTRRIWRAMHVSRTFSARDIAILAEGRRPFVDKVIRVLVASGEVVAAGKRRNVNGYLETIYRIKARDAFYLKYLLEEEALIKERHGKKRGTR